MRGSRSLGLAALLVCGAALPADIAYGQSRDSAQAEAQFRIARRLAAEGSANAADAMRKVAQLDPSGPFADDALVELALLQGIASWPAQLGRIEAEKGAVAQSALDAVIDNLQGSDRHIEARYYRALLQLEPLPGHDESTARLQLLSVATVAIADRAQTDWGHRARYVRAWLDEQRGRHRQAAAAYQRLVVDAADSEAARRSRVGLGRVLLRQGAPAEAAKWLQQAIRDGVPSECHAEPLRHLALRSLPGGRVVSRSSLEVQAPTTGVRTLAGLVTLPDGGIALGDRRSDQVTRFAADGTIRGGWTVPGLNVIGASPLGHIFAAAEDALYRLRIDAEPVHVASLGGYAPVNAVTADATGRVWVLDRRGDKVGRVEPGATSAIPAWAGDGVRLDSLVWDGERLVATTVRQRSVVTLEADGSVRTLEAPDLQKPAGLAVDPAGRWAVLDGKTGEILFFGAGVNSGEVVATTGSIVTRAAAIAFGVDGGLNVFDAGNATWVRLP